MRRKKRDDLNIFGSAALDLFASGMGVFLLIAIVIFPYYLKIDPDLIREIAKIKQEKQEIQDENKKLLNDNIPIKELIEKVQSLAYSIKKLEKENEDLKIENKKFRSGKMNIKELLETMDKLKEKLRSIEEELEKLKIENRKLTNENNELKKELKELEDLRKLVEQQKYEIEILNQKLEEKNKKIEELEKIIEQLKSKQGSGWGGIIRLYEDVNNYDVLFLIDTSNSMSPYLASVMEYIVSIANGNKGNIYVTVYNGRRSVDTIKLQSKMLGYSDNIQMKLNNFVYAHQNTSNNGSPLYRALSKAIDYDVDNIILLTNSMPTDENKKTLLGDITSANQKQNDIEIYTNAFGKNAMNTELMNFLKALAGYNKGTFQGVYNTK